MTLFGTQKINELGHLEIGGCDTIELAEKFGTPLYIMDEDLIRDNCRRYLNAFRQGYNDVAVAFAGKSFMTSAMCKIVEQEGMHIDVASAGELYTAKNAGFPMDRVIFHGSNKSVEELQMAIDLGVGRIVADNFLEIARLNELAQAAKKRAGIMLRLTPGIDPHTHKLIRTGQSDTKFGFNITDGSAMWAVQKALDCPHVELKGLHCHAGSQLLDTEAHEDALKIMFQFISELANIGIETKELNFGGGLGIRYQSDDVPPSIEDFAKRITDLVNAEVDKYELEAPKLLLEPGRSIVGEAGTTIYRIGAIKDVNIQEEPGKRTYVSVDGGLSDNPRPALYDARYNTIVANKANDPADTLVTIAGKHCETDTLIQDVMIAKPAIEDVVAVFATGAYNYAMASNYNRLTRPAVVLVSKGNANIIVMRETFDDLVKNDVIPESLGS